MLQGVASNVGKASGRGLCRLFHQEGYKVVFKAWNMALNSYMTLQGKSAAPRESSGGGGVLLTADMNPIKPTGAGESQVVVRAGPEDLKLESPWRRQPCPSSKKPRASEQEYELIMWKVPKQRINLRHRCANMGLPLWSGSGRAAADIDRGGAWRPYGDHAPLQAYEGFSGRIYPQQVSRRCEISSRPNVLEERGGRPVLGVVPYRHDLSSMKKTPLG